MHESSMHLLNCMVTLTYEQHLEPSCGVYYPHFQRFMKDLRQKLRRADLVLRRTNPSHEFTKIKFFMSGEYRPGLKGPHFHAILFGVDFPDKKLHKKNDRGDPVYTSAALESIWTYGFSSIVDVTFDSCAYVARYCLDKVHGQFADWHYMGVNPEISRMSLKPGIGASWLDKYHESTYRDDAVVMQGHKYKPPRYYDKRFAKIDADQFSSVLEARELYAIDPKHQQNSTPERLAVREAVALSKLNLRKRDF